ncbi:MAG: linear amide C-N hydrolase [Clostridia bacterium]|nr:linear amide C-N hydrolase [Clostridia bacterium]
MKEKISKDEAKAQKNLAAKNREATLGSFRQIDGNIWSLEYKSAYGLDALLKKGVSSIMDAVVFLQKEVQMPHLAVNPAHGGFACSTFNAKNPEGDYIFGRNFDYKAAPCVVCWTSPENGYRSMSVIDSTFFLHGTKYLSLKNAKRPLRIMGAPYMAMDGINEKGFSCAVLEIKTKATKQQTGKKPIITTVALRAVLDKCATVDEAIELFAAYDMHDSLFINYHYQLADAEGNSAIIEYVDNKMYVIKQEKKDDNLILTNYFLTPGGDNHDGRGYKRYDHIENTLKQHNGILTEENAMKLLSECTLNYRHKVLKHPVITLWSAVYNCNEKSMLLCAGMDYSKKYKCYIDRPGEVLLWDDTVPAES